MSITAHELARQLFRCEDLPVNASIDISTCDDDADRRVFTCACFGINDEDAQGEVVILFASQPFDNSGRKI